MICEICGLIFFSLCAISPWRFRLGGELAGFFDEFDKREEGKKGQPLMFGMDEGKGESLGEENDVRL